MNEYKIGQIVLGNEAIEIIKNSGRISVKINENDDEPFIYYYKNNKLYYTDGYEAFESSGFEENFLKDYGYIFTIHQLPFDTTKIINLETVEVYKKLNIDKIKNLDDVKRILEFLNIQARDDHIQTYGFEKVKDLFEE